ncbi:MAG: multiple sugar transport system substrate-binding protein [Clostridiales bacterium]|nr:multiple sugar transport system substrate-binding protein [Clostridiales bacterium]
MNVNLRKLIVLVLSVALVISIFGCTSEQPAQDQEEASDNVQGTQQPSEPPPPKEKTKVEVISWWDFTNSEPLKQLKAKFEEKNPDMQIEYIQVGTGYADKVLTMIAGGGDLPDVMMLAMDKVPIFADKGAILNLDKYMTDEYKNSLYPVVLNALTYNGSVYAVPRDITSKVMFLNKKMFDDAGVPYPDENWTWDDFRQIAKQLTKDNSQWGFYFPKYNDGFYHFLAQNGGGLVTPDGKASLLGKPESIEALHFLQDMIIKDKSVPSETQAKQFGNSDSAPFIAGKVAMVAGGLATTVDLDKNNVEYLIRPLPVPKGKEPLSTAFVNAWAIPNGAKNPDLSWRVLEFFSSEDGQKIALDTGMGLPASKDVDTSAFEQKRPDNKYLIESLEYSVPFPSPLYGVDFFKVVQQEFDLMWLGQRSVEDAVAAVEKVAPDVLAGKK